MKYVKLLRVEHWIKNLLIFLPIVFNMNLMDMDLFMESLWGVVMFSVMSSAIYIFNDMQDVENDRKHPSKCTRPIASGDISLKTAWCIFSFLIVLLIGGAIGRKNIADLMLLIYFICNICYSMGLKNYPLIDVVLLVLGYMLRILYGGMLTGITVSEWLYLTVLSAACYFGFGKRRNELRTFGDNYRRSLSKYTYDFLDKSMQLFLGMTLVFYALWCSDKQTVIAESGSSFMWSVPIVFLIFLKYNLHLEEETCDGDPVEVVLGDKFIICLIITYIVIALKELYI